MEGDGEVPEGWEGKTWVMPSRRKLTRLPAMACAASSATDAEEQTDAAEKAGRATAAMIASGEAVERCRRAMEALQQRLAKPDGASQTLLPADRSSPWRWEAVRRWGPALPPENSIPSWETFVQSRTSTPPPLPSPFALLQGIEFRSRLCPPPAPHTHTRTPLLMSPWA